MVQNAASKARLVTGTCKDESNDARLVKEVMIIWKYALEKTRASFLWMCSSCRNCVTVAEKTQVLKDREA